MAIFSISDIIIAITLIINSFALMSTKFKTKPILNTSIKVENNVIEPEGEQDTDILLPENSIETSESLSILDRLRNLVFSIRKLSSLIILWNIVFMVLMIGVFGS